MYLYFVGDSNKAYYESPAFGRVLAYYQNNFRTCKLRDMSGRRSLLVENVTTVTQALDILTAIRDSDPV